MKKFTVVQVCFIALSAVINIIGGNLALVLRLPIYLDSIGTFLASALLGPVGGVLAGVVSGVISGITTDIYSLYFIPVQIVTDYADRLISIAIVVAVLAVLSNSMEQQIREGKTNGQV